MQKSKTPDRGSGVRVIDESSPIRVWQALYWLEPCALVLLPWCFLLSFFDFFDVVSVVLELLFFLWNHLAEAATGMLRAHATATANSNERDFFINSPTSNWNYSHF